MLKPAAHGTGVIAGGAMRAVLKVQVLLTYWLNQGSSNPHNVVKATLDALSKLRTPMAVAAQRNVSLQKVFKG